MNTKRSTMVSSYSSPNVFPIRIGGYIFVRTMEHPEKRSPYKFAIYQDARGASVLAKRWTGTVKGPAYTWLRNEASIMRILTAIIEREPKAFTSLKVNIPRYLGFVEEGKNATMFTEFVGGVYLANWDAADRRKILKRVLEFLRVVDAHLTPGERRLLRRRGPWHMALVLPLMAFRAMLRYPNMAWIVVRSCAMAYGAIPSLFRRGERVFMHRDVHSMNIIVRGNTALLLDFQLSVLADPLWELAVIAVHGWHDKTIRDAMPDLEQAIAHFDRHAYRAFAAYAGVVDLACGRSHRHVSVGEYLNEMAEGRTDR